MHFLKRLFSDSLSEAFFPAVFLFAIQRDVTSPKKWKAAPSVFAQMRREIIFSWSLLLLGLERAQAAQNPGLISGSA